MPSFCERNPNNVLCKVSKKASAVLGAGKRFLSSGMSQNLLRNERLQQLTSAALSKAGINISADKLKNMGEAAAGLADRFSQNGGLMDAARSAIGSQQGQHLIGQTIQRISNAPMRRAAEMLNNRAAAFAASEPRMRYKRSAVELAEARGTGAMPPNIFNASMDPLQKLAFQMSGDNPQPKMHGLRPEQALALNRAYNVPRTRPGYDVMKQQDWMNTGKGLVEQQLTLNGFTQAPMGAATSVPRSNELSAYDSTSKRIRMA